MKTKALLFIGALLTAAAKLSAQDIAPGINYSYNPPASDGIISNITIDVVNNDGTSAGSFDVSMYLYDMNTSNYWVIGTQNVGSLSGNSLITISNWNIDINNTPNIPAGTYRLGIWVDSNNDISESDENNNTGLLSGNINYTPSSASGIETPALNAASVKCMPNPANAQANVVFTLAENAPVTLEVYDMTGKLVKSCEDETPMEAGQHTIHLSTETLPAGIYFWTLKTGEISVTRRLVIAH